MQIIKRKYWIPLSKQGAEVWEIIKRKKNIRKRIKVRIEGKSSAVYIEKKKKKRKRRGGKKEIYYIYSEEE